MNKALLKSYMEKFEDTQADLAKAIELSPGRFSAKLNSYPGADFTSAEISTIKTRYNLNSDEINEIFFEN